MPTGLSRWVFLLPLPGPWSAADAAFQALAFSARPDGRIWQPTAVRTFFEGRGGYWPYQNLSALPRFIGPSTLGVLQRSASRAELRFPVARAVMESVRQLL